MAIQTRIFKIVSLLFFVLGNPYNIPCLFATEYTIEKKLDNGDDTSRFVWVMLAEGYKDSELEKFQNDTSKLINVFFAASPWKEYKSGINIYTVFTASLESGADHPSDGTYVDTAFDATFDTYGMARLLTVNDAKAILAASRIPDFDTVFVLVNDKQYGGSGGSVIVASLHEASNEIMLHEAGHIIGKLADEYTTPYPGYPAGDSEPNVTCQTKKEKIKWNSWIEPDTPLPSFDNNIDNIGLFEGARYLSAGIYRPRYTCKMRSLNQPYCEICSEALILNMYSYFSLIEKYDPENVNIDLAPGKAVTIGIETLEFGGATPYAITWDIDNETIEDESQPFLALSPSLLKKGEHTVSISARDASGLVKTDPHGFTLSKHSWNITKNFCSGKLSGTIADIKTGLIPSNATITVSNIGTTIQPNNDGTYTFSDVPCGVYTVTVGAIGYKTYKKEISIVDAQEKVLPISVEATTGSFYITGTIIGDACEDAIIALTGSASTSLKINKNGNFMLGPLGPGEYTLTPKAAGYLFFPPVWKMKIKDKDIAQMTFAAKKIGAGNSQKQ